MWSHESRGGKGKMYILSQKILPVYGADRRSIFQYFIANPTVKGANAYVDFSGGLWGLCPFYQA